MKSHNQPPGWAVQQAMDECGYDGPGIQARADEIASGEEVDRHAAFEMARQEFGCDGILDRARELAEADERITIAGSAR